MSADVCFLCGGPRQSEPDCPVCGGFLCFWCAECCAKPVGKPYYNPDPEDDEPEEVEKR